MAERLFIERRHLPLVGQIRRVRELTSLHSDLMMALESLAALEPLLIAPTDPSNHRLLITQSALLNNAIVLYSRATTTTSGERRGFDIRPLLTDAEKLAHKELVDLRNDAVAHFGSGGSYEGEWQAELVLWQFKGSVAKSGVLTRRQMVDPRLVQRARAQISVAKELLRKICMERNDDVTNAIAQAAEDDPEFYREITKHPLNLAIFLRSQQAADAALDQWAGGYAMGGTAG